MIRVAVAAATILMAGVALSHPFNLEFDFNQFKQLEKQLGMVSPLAAALKPQFSSSGSQLQRFSTGPQQFSFSQQFSPVGSQYSLSQQYNPQDYLSDPLGSFPPKSYSLTYDQSDLTKMVGENFFKRPGQGEADEEETSEEIPYSVLQDFGTYEQRFYPAAKFACVKSEVDISKDPMAGLDKENPFMIMTSKRWKKTPSSIMFKELFKYIAGVNQEGQEVEMTRPVSTLHKVEQKQAGGDIEVQEMCFYLPQKFQASPPKPLDRSPVYILQRPEMAVYALRFGGFALTADTWLAQRDLLEKFIVGKAHHENEYFTNGYNSPFALTNRRNEIWIQCNGHATKPADVVEAAPLPGQAVEAVPLPGQAVEAVPLPGQAVEAVPLPAEGVKIADQPADWAKPANLPDEETKPLPADATKTVPLPVDAATKPASLPADATKPAPLPADEVKPAPLPADEVKPAPLPAEVADAAALPADATKPDPLPADAAEPVEGVSA